MGRKKYILGFIVVAFLSGASIFVVGGSIVFARDAVVPLLRWAGTATWEETPCTIVSSQVDRRRTGSSSTGSRHRQSSGVSYKFQVRYAYSVDGTEYSSDHYSFLDGSSIGREKKERLAARYPEGSAQTCYINPADPTEAVLTRRIHGGFLRGLVGLVFVGAGLVLAWVVLRSLRPKDVVDIQRGEIQLPSVRSPFFRPPLLLLPFFGLLLVAVCLAYAASIVDPADDPRNGYFIMAFSTTLATVAIGFTSLYHLLGALNPRPALFLAPGTPRPGDVLHVRWSFSGRVERLQRITMSLDCIQLDRESGSNTPYLGGRVLMSLPIVESELPDEFLVGTCVLPLPESAVPSQVTKDDRIFWQVKVRSQTRGLPGMREYLGVTVLPGVEEQDRT